MALAQLLNLEQDFHTTMVVADYSLGPELRSWLAAEAGPLGTELLILDDWSAELPLHEAVRARGVRPEARYISLLLLLRSHSSFDAARAFSRSLPRGDLARLELPTEELGFTVERARWLLDVALAARFDHQDRIAEHFFGLLERRVPYEVTIETGGGVLRVEDRRPWFQLAGRLSQGEVRILPGGEVAYTGESIRGVFRVDGALLATPQRPEGTELARALTRESASLSRAPLDLEIADGEVRRVRGGGTSTAVFERLFEEPGYRRVTEVGISFNDACEALVHDWPAASNEGYPGVHIAIGGDPDPERPAEVPLVHVDLIARSTRVLVNDRAFMDRRR